MYTERYLPKKYRDSRRRRQRNRLRRAILIAVLIIVLLIGGYILVRWVAGGSGPATHATEPPAATDVVSASLGPA